MMHAPVTEDPDLAQAIVDLRPVVVEIREAIAALDFAQTRRPAVRPKPEQRAAAEAEIAELKSRVAVRAERLGLAHDDLMDMITEDLAARRHGGHVDRCTSGTLADAVSTAIMREARAHQALSAAQIELRSATAARVDAEREYAAYAAGLPAVAQ